MNSPLDSRGQPAPSSSSRRVAIITGGSQGIGAGLVSAFRGSGYAVVATSRTVGAADEDDSSTIARSVPRRLRSTIEVGGQFHDELLGVDSCSVDEARFASTQERASDQEHAG